MPPSSNHKAPEPGENPTPSDPEPQPDKVERRPDGEWYHYTLHLPPDTPPVRLDRWLASQFKTFSRRTIQEAIERGDVRCDAKPVKRTAQTVPGQNLSLVLFRQRLDSLQPDEQSQLDILFEDASIIVVNKSPGMVTHPGSGTDGHTLVHALLHHCGPDHLSRIGGPLRPGIVHRLDKETSGLLVVAKTDGAHLKLVETFQQRNLEKIYLTCVSGSVKERSGKILQPIGRHPVHRTRMAVVASGKPAETHWETLSVDPGGYSRWRVRILSGRTHQIRVHASWAGHPVLGDTLYGYRRQSTHPQPPRILLHAAELALPHPETGQPLQLKAPVPTDMRPFWDG